MEIMERIAQALNILYPDLEVYFDDIEQNAEVPCFTLQLVSMRDIKIAGIKCNKAYTIDIVYEDTADSNVFKVMETLTKKLYSKIPYINYDIEVLEKAGHFIIEIMTDNPKLKDEYQSDSFYKRLLDTVKRLSEKECYFMTLDLTNANWEKGFFVIKPISLESTTISLNHRKEIEQEIELIYLENSNKNSLRILDNQENFMELLVKDIEFKKNYINLDYLIQVANEEEEHYSDASSFITTLNIKRRG